MLPGPRLTVSNGDRKHIDLYEDSSFTAIGVLNGFLSHHRRHVPTKVNSLALVEFTLNFLMTYDRILSFADPLPGRVELVLGFRHARDGLERPVYMSYGRVDGMDYDADWGQLGEAPADAFSERAQVNVEPADDDGEHFDLGSAAYELIRRTYNRFGLPDEAVPYTDANRTRVDLDQIRQQ